MMERTLTMKQFSRLITVCLVAGGLIACGTKGALYRPEKIIKQVQKQVSDIDPEVQAEIKDNVEKKQTEEE